MPYIVKPSRGSGKATKGHNRTATMQVLQIWSKGQRIVKEVRFNCTDATGAASAKNRAAKYANELRAKEAEQWPLAHGFYLLSLKRTSMTDKFITWWGPNNADYNCRLDQGGAGTYNHDAILADLDYYNNGVRTLAIPVGAVLALASIQEEVGDFKNALAVPNTRDFMEALVGAAYPQKGNP